MWHITYRILRQKEGQPPRYETFSVEVEPEEHVLDGVEKVWAFQERSLTFRHACHHATCGACGMRVNGQEKLTCITKIGEVTRDGGAITLEPLRNFPVLSDLVVDLGPLYRKMEAVRAPAIIPLQAAPLEGPGIAPPKEVPQPPEGGAYLRLADCIECGLCISACPAAAADPDYLGPAPLAAIHLQSAPLSGDLLALADSREGVWRCHSAYECSAVCPSNVDPGWRIMDLRRRVAMAHLKPVFGGRS
ncbi:MAG: succinate dehydrogenase iron-sulfur subunit [Anaerolineales bacterium]